MFKRFGGGNMFYITECDSPFGKLTLASDGENLVGLWLEEQKYHGASILNGSQKKDDVPVFDMAKKWLKKYFAGENPDASKLPLKPIGGDFRQEVWNILNQIQYGKVVTYGDIAKKIAVKMGKKKMSAQAVGGAVGHNPISIIIPCHRVIGSNGNLTGYAGGIDIKIKLLKLEGVDMSGFSLPKKCSTVTLHLQKL